MAKEWTLGEKTSGLKKETEYAVLVSLITPQVTEPQAHEYLDELEFLAETAGAKTVKRFTQRLQHPEHRTFIGKGKVEEIQQYLERHEEVNMVIFDDDLSGKQTNNLEEALKVKIVDRSTLILDIFASRAQTAQAKTQVELAQMKYLLPRLRGLWTHLERQRGGIGMRGPGETQIETDRRLVQYRVKALEEKLREIDRQNQTQRKTRGELIRVALVGYTNVGKSTLLNLLSKSEVLAENKLFATLDTTVRKVVFGAMPFLLSDTVGFIRKLPHHLVESFKSTLDEVRESDILLHVVDVAHPQFEDHIRTVQLTLQELGAVDKPTLMVYNKIDLYRERWYDDLLDAGTKTDLEAELRERLQHTFGENVFISARSKEGIDDFRERLTRLIKEAYVVRYPHQVKGW
jgi:GTP-binding protein HflX